VWKSIFYIEKYVFYILVVNYIIKNKK